MTQRFKQPKNWVFKDFTNTDGKAVRYGTAKPKGDIKGTVVMTTGYADFTEAYFETIHDYLDRGFEVWMMDWPGHGGSERYDPKRPMCPGPKGMPSYVRDLNKFYHKIINPAKDKPVFLNTHSMGGHVALHYIQQYPKDFNFVVMAAPFVDYDMHPFRKHIMGNLARVLNKVGFGNKRIKSNSKAVDRIKETRKKYAKQEPVRMRLHKKHAKENPSLRIGDPTISWLTEAFNAATKLNNKKILEKIETPVLIGAAENDGLVDNGAAKRASHQMPNAKYVCLKGATHLLWTEREEIREVWWKEVDTFIEEEIKGFYKNQTPLPKKNPKNKL